MSGAMAFLAGMGTGYIDGKKRKQDQDRLDAKDKREQTLFDAQIEKINQDKADRTALKYAGETVTARPLDGPQPEAAYVNGQEPTQPIGYISGNGPSARTFAGNGVGQEQAAANAMEQNKPGAWETRAANLARQGNAFAATALANNASIRNNTAQAGIAEQTLADQTTARSIQTLADFDAVGTYISDTPADNNGGKFKGKFMLSADGKTQIFNKLNDDGTYTPTQRVFPNTPQGLTQAKEALAGAMTPEQRRVQAQHIFSNELAEKTFTLSERKTAVAEKQAAIADRKMDYLMYGAAAKARAGVGGGAGSGADGPPQGPAFNPLASFDSKKAQAVAYEQAAAKTDEKGQPLSPKAQGQLAEKIYRGMEDSFAMENTRRHVIATVTNELRSNEANPTAYAASYAKAIDPKLGLSPEILIAHGFKPPATPASKPPSINSDSKPAQTQESATKYPHVGYATVQGAIDGAARGDAKAMVYIKQIANSGLPIQQRTQIEKIISGK